VSSKETPECVPSLSPKQPVSLRARSHDSTLIGRGKYMLPTLLAAAGVPEAGMLPALLAAAGVPEAGIFGTDAEINYSI
jgi:hypothetical protein